MQIMKLDIDFKGYQQAVLILRQLPDSMQQKMLLQTLKTSTRPMLSAAKQHAPHNKGLLKKMLRIVKYRRIDTPTEVAVAIKHVFGKSKTGKINEFYGKFVHEGTKERTARKRGGVLVFTNAKGEKVFTRKVVAMQANPYLERAYNDKVDSTIQSFGNELDKNIGRFLSRNFKPVQ